MSKKEFYEKYIKDDRTEDEKMMDIIHENARKERVRYNYRKNANQRNRGVKIVSAGVLISYIIIIILLLVMLWK